jgi:hypothetical protein
MNNSYEQVENAILNEMEEWLGRKSNSENPDYSDWIEVRGKIIASFGWDISEFNNESERRLRAKEEELSAKLNQLINDYK